jgi:hypothetical protein
VVHTDSEEVGRQSAQWFIPTAKKWGGQVHSGLYLQRRGGAAECTVVQTYSKEVGRQSAQWFIPTAKRWGGRVHSGSYLQQRGGAAECTVVHTYSEEVGRQSPHNLILVLGHNVQPIDVEHPKKIINFFLNLYNNILKVVFYLYGFTATRILPV